MIPMWLVFFIVLMLALDLLVTTAAIRRWRQRVEDASRRVEDASRDLRAEIEYNKAMRAALSGDGKSPLHGIPLYHYVQTIERRVNETLTTYGADVRAVLDHFGLELVEVPPQPGRRLVRPKVEA